MKLKLKHQPTTEGKVDVDSPFYELIQEAYRVFKQAPTEHGVCECCMCPEIRKDFFKHAQANIPLNYINDWFFAAADIPLKKDVWRFILPRVLEILASGEDPSTTALEVSLSRFDTGKEENWTNNEWAVLDRFQKLFLTHSEAIYDDCLDDIICMFASAGWLTEELFTQISEWPTEKLVNQLWRDWCDFPNPDIWITAFWDYEHVPMAFYTSKEMLEKITDYALDNGTQPDLAKKAMAVTDLIQIRST